MGRLQYQSGNFMIVILVTKLSDAIVIPIPIVLGLCGVTVRALHCATGTAPSLRAAKSCRGQAGGDIECTALHELL